MAGDAIDLAVFGELQAAAGVEFVAELVGTFLQEAPVMLADLNSAAAIGDADTFRRAAHSLKSNASTFGAMQLAAHARDLEHGGLVSGTQPSSSALVALDGVYAAAAAALTTLKEQTRKGQSNV